MKRSKLIYPILLALLLGGLAMPVRAAANIRVVSDATSLTFPESILFTAEFQGSGNITAAVLEYGVNELTCGTVEGKAFPQVTPATDVKVQWTWDMRQSGSLPPGATVWWRWDVTDANGTQFTSPTQTQVWLDNIHPWQVIAGGNINLHYYADGASFGQQLHDTAAQALVRLSKDVGVNTDSPVDIYIYANQSDMLASILYSPSWVGGQAFPGNNSIMIGISPDQLDWGKSTEAHELTHVLIGHLTFSCLGFIPQWLNEGLAVYGEGGPQAAEQQQFDQARTADTLPSIRSLTGAFTAEDTRVGISYAEAYSVVDFMLKTYGRDKMTTLLLDLKNGQTTDDALQAVYSIDTDGLENAWRAAIGAKQHAGSAQPTPVPTPTDVPTYVPAEAAQSVASDLATPQVAQAQASATPPGATQTPTPGASAAPTASAPTGPSNTLTSVLIVAAACLLIAVILAGLVVLLIVRSNARRPK